MILDERLEFADAVSVVGSAGTVLIGDVVDLGLPARDPGAGEPIYFVVTVDTEVTAAGAGTIAVSLVSDAQPAIATDGSATVHFASRGFVTNTSALNDAALNGGGVMVAVALPWEGPVYERYLGVLVTIGAVAVGAGKINAFLTLNPSSWKVYADAVN